MHSSTSNRTNHRGRERGFTLIEIMVVVAIVSILGAIALPSYGGYVMRAKIASATALLKEARQRLENRYADERSYAAADGSCLITGFLDSDSQFTLACTTASAGQQYTFTATGSAGMAGFKYAINEAGVEQTLALPTGWSTATLPLNRFVMRKE